LKDDPWPGLVEGEVEIEDRNESLWRQVNSAWVDGDTVAKLAFLPSEKDQLKLSVCRSSKVSAREAYEEYTRDLGLTSVGVLALTTADVITCGLRTIDDKNSIDPPDPCPSGHSYIDFRRIATNSAMKRAAAALRDAAQAREWAFVPDPDK
jgi:hypothetical protein